MRPRCGIRSGTCARRHGWVRTASARGWAAAWALGNSGFGRRRGRSPASAFLWAPSSIPTCPTTPTTQTNHSAKPRRRRPQRRNAGKQYRRQRPAARECAACHGSRARILSIRLPTSGMPSAGPRWSQSRASQTKTSLFQWYPGGGGFPQPGSPPADQANATAWARWSGRCGRSCPTTAKAPGSRCRCRASCSSTCSCWVSTTPSGRSTRSASRGE